MVLDPEFLSDQVGHSRTRPQVGGETRVAGAAEQGFFELLLAPDIELGRAAWHGLGLDRPAPLFQEARLPAADRTPADAELAGDVHRGNTLLKQRGGLQTTLLELGRAAVWSHAIPPAQSIGHYLGEYQ